MRSKHLSKQPHHAYLWPVLRQILREGNRSELLDAGCGDGFIANEVNALGYRVTAIDSDQHLIALARSRFPKLRFECLSLYDDLSQLAPASGWDVILCCEVIEHLISPRAFIENMRPNLSPAGRLVLTTPYHGYLKNVVISLSGRWDRHHSVNWEGGHVKFFSIRTMSELLTNGGFEDLRFCGIGRIPFLWKSMACEARLKAQHKPRPEARLK